MLEFPMFKARIMAVPLFSRMLLYYYNKKEIASTPIPGSKTAKNHDIRFNQKSPAKFVKKIEKRC